MKKVKKIQTTHHFKYSHAYDDYGNYVSRENAINDKRKYYVHKDKQVSLYLKTSSNGNLHWVAYPNQDWRDKNNVVHNWSKVEKIINESYEHRKFKGSIIENGFFYYKQNKVFIINGDEECRIVNSKFRSDVSGNLLDGTPCIVEVIKTSDLSENKLNHINKKQILTFKIYIDEYGNQISERDYIVGNKEIEQITKSIRKGEGKLAELRETNSQFRKITKKESYKRLQIFNEWLEERKNKFKRETEQIKNECNAVRFGEGSEIKIAEQRNESLTDRIEYRREEINKLRARFDEVKREIEYVQREISYITRPKQDPTAKCEEYKDSISRSRNELITLEKTFIELAERCKVEWFRNKWMTTPIQDKINELKYWTS